MYKQITISEIYIKNISKVNGASMIPKRGSMTLQTIVSRSIISLEYRMLLQSHSVGYQSETPKTLKPIHNNVMQMKLR